MILALTQRLQQVIGTVLQTQGSYMLLIHPGVVKSVGERSINRKEPFQANSLIITEVYLACKGIHPADTSHGLLHDRKSVAFRWGYKTSTGSAP